MKIKPFADSTVTQPENNKDGTWGFQEFPAMGSDIYHGDFPSRAAARQARAELLRKVKGSGVRAEMEFTRV